jgi:hypothetical protein
MMTMGLSLHPRLSLIGFVSGCLSCLGELHFFLIIRQSFVLNLRSCWNDINSNGSTDVYPDLRF